MGEDEKESDEIEINVGGERGQQRRQNRAGYLRFLLHLLNLFVNPCLK